MLWNSFLFLITAILIISPRDAEISSSGTVFKSDKSMKLFSGAKYVPSLFLLEKWLIEVLTPTQASTMHNSVVATLI